MQKLLSLSVLSLGLLAAGHAGAAISWNTAGSVSNATPYDYGNTRTFNSVAGSDSSVSMMATAWSNTLGDDRKVGGVLPDNQSIESAYLAMWTGGLGSYNKDAGTSTSYRNKDDSETSDPEHSVDNNQRYDMVLMSFSEIINLKTIDLNWYDTDSDITVMAYTGSATPAQNSAGSLMNGLKYQDLASNGWSLVGHYADIGTSPFNLTTSVNSSYWLVGAYNPLVGSAGVNSRTNASGSTVGTLSLKNDYIKLAAVSGVKFDPPKPPTGAVSEPASLALTGLALAGMIGLRRRKTS